MIAVVVCDHGLVMDTDITRKTQEMKKLQALSDETGEKKDYISQLDWKSARTVFEIRTNMIKVACNYGKQENNTCIVCGEQDTTEHIFLCEGNQSDTLTPEVYQQLIQKGGPSTERMKLQQIACDIQQVIKDRKQLQEIISRTG